MKANGLMTRNVVCIGPGDSLKDAYEIMTEWEIRHLPVLAGKTLVGILSDRDVLLRSQPKERGGIEVPLTPVGEAMTPHPMTCGLFATVGHLAALMVEHKIDSVPVLDDGGALVGLITSADLLQILAGKDEAEERKPLPFLWHVHASVRPGFARVN